MLCLAAIYFQANIIIIQIYIWQIYSAKRFLQMHTKMKSERKKMTSEYPNISGMPKNAECISKYISLFTNTNIFKCPNICYKLQRRKYNEREGNMVYLGR